MSCKDGSTLPQLLPLELWYHDTGSIMEGNGPFGECKQQCMMNPTYRAEVANLQMQGDDAVWLKTHMTS